MLEMIIIGLISAFSLFAILLIAGKTTLRRILGFGVTIDIILSGALIFMFAGTFSGMVAALAGGLFISAVLRTTALIVGTEKLSFNGWKRMPAWTPA